MSNLFRYLLSPEQVVSTLLRNHPEDEAMARAVGGDFERFGVLEHAVLRQSAGLEPGSSVIDVGCGSGRLAVQLARHPELGYLGTDVVPTLLEYARRRAARPDFRFINIDRIAIPAADAGTDIVCFFSVLTHLLHEESFLYLQEAQRVLKPGGRIAFSFLEYETPIGWTVFEANLNWVRTRVLASQINVFLHRGMIRLWARRLGLRVEILRDGEPGAVTVGPAEATDSVPAGSYAFGQSLCVLRKPLPDEVEETEQGARARADDPERAARRAERKVKRGTGGTAATRASDAALGAPDPAAAGSGTGAVTTGPEGAGQTAIADNQASPKTGRRRVRGRP